MTIKLFNDISNQLIVYKDEAKPSWSMESLSQDSIAEIFEHCFSQADFLSIQSLACANLYFYEALKKKVEDVDLQKACPFLSIISAQHAEKCGFPAQPPSAFSKFEVIKAYMTMNPHVEAQAGVTLFNFTLPDQLTLREIVQRMGNAGITADIFWNLGDRSDALFSKIGDVVVGQAFPAMGANNVFKHTRGREFAKQLSRVNAHGCQLPTVEQYLLHMFFVQKVFNRCLFGEHSPRTVARASTLVNGIPSLVVGDSDSTSFKVFSFEWAHKHYGAGGWWKF